MVLNLKLIPLRDRGRAARALWTLAVLHTRSPLGHHLNVTLPVSKTWGGGGKTGVSGTRARARGPWQEP